MAGTTITTASAILKKVYPGLIENQLNEESVGYRMASKAKQKITFGQNLVRSIRTSRSQGLGARNETDNLPGAGYQVYASPVVNVKRNYHRGQITGAVIRDSAADDAAFEEALAADIMYNIDDLTAELDFQIWRGTGKRASVNGTVTANNVTFTVSNTSPYAGTRFLGVNEVIDIYNGSTLQASSLTISAISDSVTFVVSAGSATTVSNGAFVYRAGNFDGTTVKELTGLQIIVDDTTNSSTYFGLSKTTYTGLQAGYVKNSAGTLTETNMQAAIDGARQAAGGKIDLITTSYGVRRSYSGLLTSNKRYPSPNSMSLEGGYRQSSNFDSNTGSGLAFDDVEVVATHRHPTGEMYFLDTRTFTFFEQSDMEWVDNNGSILHPMMAANNTDAYQYAMYHEGEFYCEKPAANAVIRGITES